MRQSIKTTALLCFAAAVSMTVEASPQQALQAGPPQERQAQVQQEPTDSSVLYFTLDEAMSYALEHNWDLQNSSIAVRQAEADRWAAIASMLPQVNGTLDYSNYMGYEMAFGETGLSIAMPPYGSIGVNAALAVSGAQVISALIGKISVEMSDVTRRQSQQEVAENCWSVIWKRCAGCTSSPRSPWTPEWPSRWMPTRYWCRWLPSKPRSTRPAVVWR